MKGGMCTWFFKHTCRSWGMVGQLRCILSYISLHGVVFWVWNGWWGWCFLGYESTNKIIGQGKVNLKLMDGSIRTLPSVIHIPGLARNLIYVRKMNDTGVKIVFEKETYRMLWGEMVFLRGVWIGTLYKLLGRTISDRCNSSIVLDIEAEEEKTIAISREKDMFWHQTLGHIEDKGI